MLSIDDIKRIRLFGQHLTNKTDKRTVVRDLNGLQSQFMSNAFHGLRIRCNGTVTEENFGDGLVKNWTLRGTVHVFAEEDLPLFIRKNYRVLDFTISTWWNSRPSWNSYTRKAENALTDRFGSSCGISQNAGRTQGYLPPKRYDR